MLNAITNSNFVKGIKKNPAYVRLRQQLPNGTATYRDDRGVFDIVDEVAFEWPDGVEKPRVAVIQDLESYPRWTKYLRFLEKNGFPCGIFDLHARNWLEEASQYDVFMGLIGCDLATLIEQRKKFFILEQYLGKICYPSTAHLMLYEDKTLEGYIAESAGFPLARTHISHQKDDALAMIKTLSYPVISKFETSSGSVGVQLVRNQRQAEKIVRQAFSIYGRATHRLYQREKDVVFFQDFIPNDGYDIRCILVDNMAFGYYRKVLKGDFRASGMNQALWHDLPEETIRIAWQMNQVIKSPILVVDMVHGLDDKYYVIEYSINCVIDTLEQLIVDETPGMYVIDPDGYIHFEAKRYWVHDLALREFFYKDYLKGRLPQAVSPVTVQWTA